MFSINKISLYCRTFFIKVSNKLNFYNKNINVVDLQIGYVFFWVPKRIYLRSGLRKLQ